VDGLGHAADEGIALHRLHRHAVSCPLRPQARAPCASAGAGRPRSKKEGVVGETTPERACDGCVLGGDARRKRGWGEALLETYDTHSIFSTSTVMSSRALPWLRRRASPSRSAATRRGSSLSRFARKP